jgi:alpha-tubulin suppressor-like RCC1 family protein
MGCWGFTQPAEDFGQIVPRTGTFKKVSCGRRHSCAIRTDDTAVCWGLNDQGQSNAPVGMFKDVSAGTDFSCGIRLDDGVVCWGKNSAGQINVPTQLR